MQRSSTYGAQTFFEKVFEKSANDPAKSRGSKIKKKIGNTRIVTIVQPIYTFMVYNGWVK